MDALILIFQENDQNTLPQMIDYLYNVELPIPTRREGATEPFGDVVRMELLENEKIGKHQLYGWIEYR